MKKLIAILAICLLPGVAWGASYYGCAASQAINSDALWCAADQVAGDDCTKDSGDFVAAAVAVQAGNTLYANGCTITLPDTDITATKISNKGDGAEGVGGGFTLDTAASSGNTYTFAVEAGPTDCLVISGNGAGNTIIGNITGGTTAGSDGIYSTHTIGTLQIGVTGTRSQINGGGPTAGGHGVLHAGTGPLTIWAGTGANGIVGGSAGSLYGVNVTGNAIITITGDITGGSTVANTRGYNSISSQATNITGNIAGGSTANAYGVMNESSGLITITGDVTAGTSTCAGASTGSTGAIKIIGNIIGTSTSIGAHGLIRWEPNKSTQYVKFMSGGTTIFASAGLASDAAGTQITEANTAAQVATTAWFVGKSTYDGSTLTQGIKAGGGAWAQ